MYFQESSNDKTEMNVVGNHNQFLYSQTKKAARTVVNALAAFLYAIKFSLVLLKRLRNKAFDHAKIPNREEHHDPNSQTNQEYLC